MSATRAARIALAATVLVVCSGCDRGKKNYGEKKSRTGGGAVAKKPVDPATAGSIEGDVRFVGRPKAPRKVEMGLPECRQAHPDGVELAVAAVKDGKLANSFVYVQAGLERWAFAPPVVWRGPDGPRPGSGEGGARTPPLSEVVIDQQGCMYEPYVAGVQIGQKLVFLNSDAFNHNVNGQPRSNTAFNVAMPQKGMRIEREFDEPEVMIKIRCDVHPWMLGWIGVVDHPHFKVTLSDGAFAFKGLPPGELTIAAWHEIYGEQTQKVTLGDRANKRIEFVFKSE